MALQTLDWAIIVGFLAASLAIGLAVARKSGKNTIASYKPSLNQPED
jgi:hypothetical protein